MLQYWTPGSGTKSGTQYTLPYVKDQTQPTLTVASAYTTLAKNDGVTLTTGTARMPIQSAVIQATFVFSPNLLIKMGYTGNLAGLQTACFDFTDYVIDGGVGTLVNALPSGTKHGATTVTSWSASAIVDGGSSPQPQGASGVLEFTITFLLPTGLIKFSDGTVQSAVALF